MTLELREKPALRELPREIAEGVWWVGGCLASNAIEHPVHFHVSAYLIIGRDKALLYDTAPPSLWEQMARDLDKLLGGRTLDYVVPSHPEIPHAGNLGKLLDKYPHAVAIGDLRDYHLYFPDHEHRMSIVPHGTTLDLGGGYGFTILDEIIEDLPTTVWGYERKQQVLFPVDALGYGHLPQSAESAGSVESDEPVHRAGECALLSSELHHPPRLDLAIIIPMMEKNSANPEHEAAMAAAMNNWLAQTWLGAYNGHGRYKGTIRISTDPELTVAEIEKWGSHPHFVQIMLNPFVGGLFGEARFWPVYEAAIRHKLAVCTHVTLQRPGPALQTIYGPPTYYIENHGQFPLVYAAHLTSMLCEGVFERFQDLRFTFVEGGYAWALPFIWRMDRHWKELRREAPALKRPPSEYLRQNVSFTRQAVEESRDPRHLARVIEILGSHSIEFATDYPHWDGDYNAGMNFAGVSPDLKKKILGLNAVQKYRLEPTRPARHWSEFRFEIPA